MNIDDLEEAVKLARRLAYFRASTAPGTISSDDIYFTVKGQIEIEPTQEVMEIAVKALNQNIADLEASLRALGVDPN